MGTTTVFSWRKGSFGSVIRALIVPVLLYVTVPNVILVFGLFRLGSYVVSFATGSKLFVSYKVLVALVLKKYP